MYQDNQISYSWKSPDDEHFPGESRLFSKNMRFPGVARNRSVERNGLELGHKFPYPRAGMHGHVGIIADLVNF